MPFNGPIDGDYSVCDPNKAPWTQEIATLTHEECIQVNEGIKSVIENYDPAIHNGEPISDFYVQSEYNAMDWEYAINEATYQALKAYDPEVHTMGIDSNGIIGLENTTENPAE
jgi:hypothetical protein